MNETGGAVGESWPRKLRRHAAALFVAAVAAVVFFPDVVFLGCTLQTAPLLPGVLGADGARPLDDSPVLDPAASAWQSEPWTRQIRDAIARGETPLWNPHSGFGQPLAANGISGAFVPLRAPLLLFPSPLLFDLTLLARLPLAALLAYFLLRALGAGWLGAVAGGGLYGLCDFFVLHVNMSHLDVEILLPLLLLAAVRLARRPDAGAVAATALATGVTLLGGNPESVALALVFAAVLALARTRERLRTALLGAAGVALGIALAAPLLLPTLELLASAAHMHPPSTGLSRYAPRQLSVLLVPEILSLLHSGGAGEAPELRWGAMGAMPWILAAAAAGAPRERRPLVLLFTAILAVSLLKIFGVAPASWIGLVPGLDRVIFPKYLQPTVALSLAALAALGIDALRAGRGRPAVAIAAALAVGATSLLLPLSHDRALAVSAWPHVIRVALVEMTLAAAALAAALASRVSGPRVAAGLTLLLAVDLRAHVPAGRPAREDLVATEPPFIERLAAEPSPIRIVGLDGVLHPNWAGAFGISDLRTLDALTLDSTLAWIRRRVAPIADDRFTGLEPFPPDVFGTAIDAAGVGFILSRAPIEDHVTRFIASRAERDPTAESGWAVQESITVAPGRPFECRVSLAARQPILRARLAAKGEGAARARVEIEPLGPRAVLFETRPETAPPGGPSAMPRETIPLRRGSGDLALEVDPPATGAGASAWIWWSDSRLAPEMPFVRPGLEGFRLEAPPGTHVGDAPADPAAGLPKGIFQRGPSALRQRVENGDGTLALVTTPVHWSAEPDRRRPAAPAVRVVWRERREPATVFDDRIDPAGRAIEISLDRFAHADSVILRFASEGAAVEWSGFGAELFRAPLEPVPLSGGPVRLYRNREALPRALVVPSAVAAGSREEALEIASDPAFDPARVVVLETDEAPAPGAPGTARVLSHRAHVVEIEVDASGPSTLLFLDAFYPGWKAFVDGIETPIARANGAFRGVAVPEGRHTVRFAYAPASFRIGLVAAAAAVVALLVLALAARRARAPRSPPRSFAEAKLAPLSLRREGER